MWEYERQPEAIYRASFAAIEAEIDFASIPESLHAAYRRVIHACGMVEIAPALRYEGDPVAAGKAALAAGKPIFVDVEMVAHGVIQRFLPAANPVICTLNAPQIPEIAAKLGTTRSAAAVEHWFDRLDGAIVAIGNAPTALFHLLEAILAGRAPKPAVIFGFPVGFVGAAESKTALMDSHPQHRIPFLTLPGRRGGSAMAAAAVNALCE